MKKKLEGTNPTPSPKFFSFIVAHNEFMRLLRGRSRQSGGTEHFFHRHCRAVYPAVKACILEHPCTQHPLGPTWEGTVMEPFDWDIGSKSGRWTREAVARRQGHRPAPPDDAAEHQGSEHAQLTQLVRLLETLGRDKAVRIGTLEDWKAALAALETQQDTAGKSRPTR